MIASPAVSGYSVDFEVKGVVETTIGLEGGIDGTVSGKYNFDCEEGCVDATASTSISPVATAKAALQEFDFEVDGPTEYNIVDVTGVEISANIVAGGVGISIGASAGNADGCGGVGQCTFTYGEGKITSIVSGGSVELFNIFNFSLPTYTAEFQLWDGGSRSCN